jgi:hypothetical protein
MYPELCIFPNCKNIVEHDGFCINHQRFARPKEKPLPKPIAKKSKKRQTEEREYKMIVAEKFLESGECELKVPGVCTRKAQGLHHLKKRTGKNYLDKEFLKRACNACNRFCETHPTEAKQMGLVLSKFN